jgi:hypothetical protein
MPMGAMSPRQAHDHPLRRRKMLQAKFAMLALFVIGTAIPAYARPSFGLRTGAGYGFGQNASTFGYGKPLSSSYAYEGFASHPGDGFTGQFEGLVGLNENIELGVGVFGPLGVDAKGSVSHKSNYSYYTTQATENEESTQKFMSVPVIVSAYYKAPVTKRITLFGGLGAGYAMGGDGVQESKFTETGGKDESSNSGTYGSGASTVYYNSTSVSEYEYSGSGRKTAALNGAFAYRGTTGVEYAFTKNISMFALVAYTGASFTPSKETTHSNSSGTNKHKNTTVYSGAYTSTSSSESTNKWENTNESVTTYVSSVPDLKANPDTSTSSNLDANGYGTITNNFDDGITSTTSTTTYTAEGSKTVTKSETKRANAPTQTIAQISAVVGVALRF